MLYRVDGADLIDATYQLIGRLFMSMLALLERKKLLSKDSEIKNLDVVMAIFLEVAQGARCYGFLEDSATEALGPAKDKKTWQPDYFDNNIVAYARKYDIELTGIHGLEKLIEDADEDVDLPVPASNADDKADPFGFVKGLKAYKKEHGGITAFLAQTKKPNSVIGGDHLDISSWTSAKRKSKAFNKKDPLGKEELAALKEGAVLSLA
ncbi:hypothetical protein B0J18DRAFT_473406 [Chaetomium sp. MPI-SDFR-AT-0129]|nr:hypothetical protein B0J18DRAFT_473406 [Chaetomium sp. MPI-SDFR-AT-0129]